MPPLDQEVLESDDFKEAVAAALKEEHGGLIKNRNQLLEEKKTLQSVVESFDGLDVQEAKKAISKMRKAEEEAARKAGDFDKLREQIDKEHASQLDGVAKERDGFKTSLERVLIERDAIEGITAADGFVKVLKPHVIGKMELRKLEDGQHVAVVLDDKGQPLLKKGASAPTDFMSVAEFVKSLRDDDEFAHAFKGAGASGGATPDRVVRGGETNTRQKPQGYQIL